MAYRIVFRGSRGNTSVEVEDLYRSGAGSCTSCKKSACHDYPGVCQHCGKLHIRYLAHVQQDIADTLLRATKEDHERALVRSDEEIATLGIALLGGKTKKAVDVGCVCVGKYLVDCGVDSGLAERFQGEVTKVTGYLQQLASLDASKSPDRLAESIRRAGLVERLRARHAALAAVRTYQIPALREPEASNAFYAAKNLAYKDYDEARERWQRENHGYNLYYRQAPTEADLVTYFDSKTRHYETKLARYTAGATLRA